MHLRKGIYLLGFLSALSALLGFLRSRFLVEYFGVGDMLDAYYAGFYLPDLIFFSIVILISSFSVIPYITKKSKKQQVQTIYSLSVLFTVFFAIFGLILFYLSDWFLKHFFSNIYYGAFGMDSLFLSRMLFLQVYFLGLATIFSIYAQFKNYFLLLGITPILYNVSIISSILLFADNLGIVGVGLGVVFGAFLYLLLPLIYFIKNKEEKINYTEVLLKDFIEIVKSSFIRSFGIFAMRISYTATGSVISVVPGFVSIFNLANEVFFSLRNIVTNSHAVASFSSVSKLYTQKKIQELKQVINDTIFSSLFWSFLAVLFSFVFIPFIALVLGIKEPEKHIVFVSFFVILALSLPFYNLHVILSRVMYAMDKVLIPLIINIFYAILTILGVYFVFSLYSKDLVLIAFVYVIVSFVTSFTFLFYMKDYLNLKEVFIKIFLYGFSVFFAYVLSYLLIVKYLSGYLGIFIQGIFVLIVFILIGFLLKDKESRLIISFLYRQIKK